MFIIFMDIVYARRLILFILVVRKSCNVIFSVNAFLHCVADVVIIFYDSYNDGIHLDNCPNPFTTPIYPLATHTHHCKFNL